MSAALRSLDRLLVLLIGLVLLVGGLGLLALRLDVLGDQPSILVVDRALQLLDEPWAYPAMAAISVVAALLGLAWLWAHVPARSASRVRLAGSDTSGRLDVDLQALADAVGERVEIGTNLAAVSATARSDGYFSLVEVQGRLRPGTEPASLVAAARQISEDLAAAFPDDGVTGRLLISAPARRTRSSRSGSTVVGDDTTQHTGGPAAEDATDTPV